MSPLKNSCRLSAMLGNRATLIGITGNIGSGKSTFCKYLEGFGYKVIYADILANAHLNTLKNELVARWGERILENAVLSKKAIAQIVFANPTERIWLNSQIHPLVLQDFQMEAASHTGGVLYFEIPLLFEEGLQDAFDLVVLISSNMPNRLERVQKRDKSDAEDIRKRLQAQIPDAQKKERADYIISNNGSLAELQEEARRLIELAAKLPHRLLKPFS